MSRDLSDRIKIASFLCTIMVILRHSLNHVAFWGEWRFVDQDRNDNDHDGIFWLVLLKVVFQPPQKLLFLISF